MLSRWVCVVLATLFALPPLAIAADDGGGEAKELIVWGAWRRKGLDAAFRKFEQEHPGWRVVVSTAAGAGQMDPQKLMCGIAGGSPPDTLIQDRLSIGEWAVRDAFLPLDDLIKQTLEEEQLAVRARDAIARGERDGAAAAALRDLITRLQRRGDSAQLRLATRLAGEMGGSQVSALAEQLVALCQGIHADTFYQACWSEAQFGAGDARRVYGIPNTADVRALYYNEDLLERAGLIDADGKPRPPRNWDELREYTLKLTARDERGNIARLGFAPLYGQGFLYHYGWLNGGEFMTADGRTCTLDDPRVVDALRYVVSVYDGLGGVERVDSFRSTFQSGELDPFLNGKVAMKIDSDFFQSIIGEHAPGLRFRVAVMPAPQGKKPLAWAAGFSWAIPRGAKNPEMAFEFIRFLMTDRVWQLRATVESRVAASRGRHFIPELAPMPHVNRDMYERFMRDNPELPDRFKQNFVRFTELLTDARFRPVTPAGQLLWDQHVRASEKALRHRSTPDEALKVAAANVQEQLDSLSAPRRGTPVNWWLVAAIVAVLAVVAFAGARRFAPKSTSRPRGESFWGFLFASPWLIGFAVFTLGPMIASVVYSLCRYDVIHDAEFVGAENYRRLAGDPLFWKSLGNTAFMILGVPLGMAVGLAIAVLLNQNVRGMRGYRTVFYLPAIVPIVASSLLWIWVLNPEVGLLNSLLRMFGADNLPRWLASPSLLFGSKTAILLMGLWGAGASMIVWLAGLKGIPQHLYESASIDGAGPWRRFWNITLPMLSPYIFFNLVTGVIATMQIFAQAYIMTQGGPDDSTMFYAYYLFNTAFRYFRMGYASAMAWILFFIVLALTLIQLEFGRKWVHYDAT